MQPICEAQYGGSAAYVPTLIPVLLVCTIPLWLCVLGVCSAESRVLLTGAGPPVTVSRCIQAFAPSASALGRLHAGRAVSLRSRGGLRSVVSAASCAYTHVHSQIRTCVLKFTNTYMHACMHVYLHTYIEAYCTRVRVRGCIA